MPSVCRSYSRPSVSNGIADPHRCCVGAARRPLIRLAPEAVPNPLEGYDGRDSPTGSARLAMCGRMH